ncbi:MAG: translation initiation factor IF-2 subunit gamma [Candidatus Aenigmarchaeota archaeon]|nr:translation initiation factor IF-2 subunit gamma [Candidatus Aenigmarchaeota archaeon]
MNLIPEVNIGLVGHVDHGKTSLTEALSGKWTDTHSEEIKRGISIRLGYADATFYKCSKCGGHTTTDKCMKCVSECAPLRTVSFVDAPGHETLMATVLSGASLMDGAMLLVAANEKCPQPQTLEHILALDIVGIKNIVVVQNKIDLVTKEQAMQNYKQIKEFLKGTVAENAPIIPISARKKINIDMLIEALENEVPTPKRDPKKEAKMYVARSFDINKPGTSIEKLGGGILGGSLVEGFLNIGEEIEIRPGLKIKEKYEPIKTKIMGIHKGGKKLDVLEPGGLAGIMTTLDPALAKSDGLSGNVAGRIGKLPPIFSEISMEYHVLKRAVGARTDESASLLKIGDPLLLNVGMSRTIGVITSIKGEKISLTLKLPICAEKGDRLAISQQVLGRWRLTGHGKLL